MILQSHSWAYIWRKLIWKDTCSTIYNSQDREATSVSTDRRMDKDDIVYTYNGILLNHNKEWSNAICSNMATLEIIILNEISLTKKNKYCMILLICGI